MIKQRDILGAPRAFFHSANTLFNIRDVLIFATHIEFGVELGGNGATFVFKFGVSKYIGDEETTLAICTMNLLDCLNK